MPRLLSLVAGPELLWVVLWFLSSWLAARNEPPTPSGNTLLEWATLAGSFLAVALTFAVFLVPGPNRWALLVRVVIASFIGLNACLFKLIDGIDYGDTRNSGVLGFWVYGVMLGGLALFPGLIIATIWLQRIAASEP